MKLLMASPGASNPLWLSLACEELRVYGVFETITHHIKSLPATIKELLQLIINRLIFEDENNNVQKVRLFLFLDPAVVFVSFLKQLPTPVILRNCTAEEEDSKLVLWDKSYVGTNALPNFPPTDLFVKGENTISGDRNKTYR